MRVDWSENLITNNNFLLMARLFDGIGIQVRGSKFGTPIHCIR